MSVSLRERVCLNPREDMRRMATDASRLSLELDHVINRLYCLEEIESGQKEFDDRWAELRLDLPKAKGVAQFVESQKEALSKFRQELFGTARGRGLDDVAYLLWLRDALEAHLSLLQMPAVCGLLAQPLVDGFLADAWKYLLAVVLPLLQTAHEKCGV